MYRGARPRPPSPPSPPPPSRRRLLPLDRLALDLPLHRVLHALHHPPVVLVLVLVPQPRRLGVGGRRGVGVAQQRLDGREDRRDVVDRAAVVLQDVEADVA